LPDRENTNDAPLSKIDKSFRMSSKMMSWD
jgi:hypothetical protein